MIYPIDCYKCDYDVFQIAFVRVAGNIGWCGSYDGNDSQWGDYIELDKAIKGDDPILQESFELLARQAADTLVRVHPACKVDQIALEKYLVDEIKKMHHDS